MPIAVTASEAVRAAVKTPAQDLTDTAAATPPLATSLFKTAGTLPPLPVAGERVISNTFVAQPPPAVACESQPGRPCHEKSPSPQPSPGVPGEGMARPPLILRYFRHPLPLHQQHLNRLRRLLQRYRVLRRSRLLNPSPGKLRRPQHRRRLKPTRPRWRWRFATLVSPAPQTTAAAATIATDTPSAAAVPFATLASPVPQAAAPPPTTPDAPSAAAAGIVAEEPPTAEPAPVDIAIAFVPPASLSIASRRVHPITLAAKSIEDMSPAMSAVASSRLAYAVPAGRTRDVQWYLICSFVILGLGILQLAMQIAMHADIGSHISGIAPSLKGNFLPFTIASTDFIALIGWLALWICFTVWIYHVHEDMRQLTGGAYPISPSQACSFCYIPIFNLFWVVYAPYKLADAIDRQFGSSGTPTSPLSVLAYQIVQQISVFSCFCLFAPSPLFFALTMRSIQAGLNQLWQFPKGALNLSPMNSPAITARVDPFEPDPDESADLISAYRSVSFSSWVGMVLAGIVVASVVTAAVLVLPGTISRREQANRAKCATNMQHIGQGLTAYANHHDGAYPGRLEDAILSGDITPELLICPDSSDTPSPGSTPMQQAANLSAGGHCSYIYTGAGLTTAQVSNGDVLLYEPPQAHEQQGMNILLADGQVQFCVHPRPSR